MRKRYVVLGLAGILALALAIPALGGPSNPVAEISKSAKKIAKSAKKKANKANKKAKAAQSSADAAQGSADTAQGSADSASSSATSAQSSADQALSRQNKFSYTSDSTGTTTTLFEGGGLRIEASCGGTDLELEARSLADDSIIQATMIKSDNTPSSVKSDDFDNNATVFLVPSLGSGDSVEGTLTFRNGQNGTIVTGTYLGQEDYQGNDCAAFGTVAIL